MQMTMRASMAKEPSSSSATATLPTSGTKEPSPAPSPKATTFTFGAKSPPQSPSKTGANPNFATSTPQDTRRTRAMPMAVNMARAQPTRPLPSPWPGKGEGKSKGEGGSATGYHQTKGSEGGGKGLKPAILSETLGDGKSTLPKAEPSGPRVATVPFLTSFTKELALSVAKKEAELRKADAYLCKTKPYVQSGLVPPPWLHEEVQLEALQLMSCATDPDTVENYRKIIRELPVHDRRQVFFLAANDNFYHPEVDPCGRHLNGTLQTHSGPTTVMDLLIKPNTFVLCSTST